MSFHCSPKRSLHRCGRQDRGETNKGTNELEPKQESRLVKGGGSGKEKMIGTKSETSGR